MVDPKTKHMMSKSDIELARLAQSGDKSAEEILLDRYQYLAHVKARSYFLTGAEHKDTVQEAMFGLYKAIKDFNEEYNCSFRSFAILCITRQIITAVKTYARKKHNPLSSYQSLDTEVPDESLFDILGSQSIGNGKTDDPLDLFICKEELDTVITLLQVELSTLEWRVFVEYLDGKSYQEIADKIGNGNIKMVDNALLRIRVKVQRYLDSPECLEEELKKLKKVKMMAGPNGYTLFLRTMCSRNKGMSISRTEALDIWNRLTREETAKWHAAARGTGPMPVFEVPEPKAEPTGSIQPEVEPELVVEPEIVEEFEVLLESELITIPQSLLPIIEKRPKLLDEIKTLVLQELEREKQVIEESIRPLAQKLKEVQKEINSLQ